MAKTWYPVIDYLTCAECGTCVANCPHGVYDTAKAPSPIVKIQNPVSTIATAAETDAPLEQSPMWVTIPVGCHRTVHRN